MLIWSFSIKNFLKSAPILNSWRTKDQEEELFLYFRSGSLDLSGKEETLSQIFNLISGSYIELPIHDSGCKISLEIQSNCFKIHSSQWKWKEGKKRENASENGEGDVGLETLETVERGDAF